MIKNQFGRRNLVPYVRAELALKLEGLFKKKALGNQGTRTDLTSVRTLTKVPSIDSPVVADFEDIDEELSTPQPIQTNYERAEPALKSEEKLQKKVSENKIPDQKQSEIKPIDTKKELGKLAGISHDTISKVKEINKEN
jgi:hypothetical protein